MPEKKERSRRVTVGRGRWRLSPATLSEREDFQCGITATAHEQVSRPGSLVHLWFDNVRQSLRYCRQ
jgi:hypothetical protein